MTHGLLFQAVVYLAAAVIAVPIAKRLGLGAVLGYLVAGVAIGPHALGLVGEGGQDVLHFAEFGVVMMLFLVGLELEPAVLWRMRRPILGLGGLQVALSAAVLAAAGIALGLDPKAALAAGLLLSMSSTAIVVSTLAERSLLSSPGGQAAFSVLLFQDLAVIPILAIFPLLGAGGAAAAGERPGWISGLLVLGAVASVVLAGRFLVRPLFQFLAAVKLRESFVAAALLLVVGTALLMQAVGLSPALGTFLAGVVLADSEYRHELESDIEPFKGLLLGLFFLSVGAQIDFPGIARAPGTVAGIVVLSMSLKALVMFGLGRLFGLERSARWLVALALAEVGEFAFVLVGFALESRIFGPELAGPLIAAVAISMFLTPLVFVLLGRVILPALTRGPAEARPADEIADASSPVVIAGFGRFGQVVGRVLRASGVETTVLDLDPQMVDVLGRIGMKVHYGDASRLDLLHAAGCAKAKVFVCAVDDHAQALTIVETVQRHFPHLQILARARGRIQYYELKRMNVAFVHRETFASAWETGIETLRRLGRRAYEAQRLGQRWRRHEEAELADLAEMWARGDDRGAIFARARKALEDTERLLRAEDPERFASDGAWDNEALRADRRPDD